MDKQTILAEFYRAQISALVERTKDTALLDYIYKLLIREREEHERIRAN